MICKSYKVYRLKADRAYGIRDMSYEKFRRLKMKVERDYYKLFENKDEIEMIDQYICDFLERIFTLSEGSIHMGDVIELSYNNKIERYFCNNVGWIKL